MKPDKAESKIETGITKALVKPPVSSTAIESEGEKARRETSKKSREKSDRFDKDDFTRQLRQRDEDSRLGRPVRRATGFTGYELSLLLALTIGWSFAALVLAMGIRFLVGMTQ